MAVSAAPGALAVLLCLIAALDPAFAGLSPDVCQQDCTRVPGALPFCGQVEYSTCMSLAGGEGGADVRAAALVLDAAANASVMAALGGVPWASVPAECRTSLKQASCALVFPVCGKDRAVSHLCFSECGRVGSVCHDHGGLEHARYICNNHVVADSATCMHVPYTPPDVGNSEHWVAGFVISVLFSFLSTLGINMQKLSMRKEKESGLNRTPFRQPMWLGGFALICSGSLLDFVAFGLAPQTKLAPLGALSLVWNIVIAPRFHDETITRRNVIATCIITVGVSSTVAFSTHDTPTYTLDRILELFEQASFIIYALVTIGVLLLLLLTARSIERHNRPWPLVHVLCYGGLGGIFGGQSVMLAKTVVELIKSALFEGGDAFAHLVTYVLIVAMAVCLFSQITFLNSGLRKFDALRVVPTYQAFWITASVLSGEFFFDEYLSLTAFQLVMFVIGTAITVFGVGSLLFRPKPGVADPCDACCSCILGAPKPTRRSGGSRRRRAGGATRSSAGGRALGGDADDDLDDDDGVELIQSPLAVGDDDSDDDARSGWRSGSGEESPRSAAGGGDRDPRSLAHLEPYRDRDSGDHASGDQDSADEVFRRRDSVHSLSDGDDGTPLRGPAPVTGTAGDRC